MHTMPGRRRLLDRERTEEGFSLLEVLVATAIAVTVSAGALQLLLAATRANAEAALLSWATTLAAQKVEELRARSLVESNAEDVDYLDSRGAVLAPSSRAAVAFARRWRIDAMPDTLPLTMMLSVSIARVRSGDMATGTPADERTLIQLATLRTRTSP